MPFLGDMYISLGITLFVCKVVIVSKTFCNEVFVILSEILLQIKSPFSSAVFWNTLFKASVADFLALSRRFWLYLPLMLLPIFSAKDKNL